MASPNEEQQHQHEAGETSQEPAVLEAQKWIEAVTGRSFGEKDFRSGLENGILLCELLSSIKPGLVKKINRLPTPIAGLDNLTMFLRGCEELGLKGTQLFDPGDLQDTSTRANLTGSDLSRKLKNVLITIYWLGKTANSCASYNGPTLDLKEFEGLLSMMRKECVSEESDSPKRNIRDSGYIDNWESERSDSLSPPRHGRDDSFDSLDSFGSRSQNTPSPDTVLRGNSDDSEGDGGSRRLPDVRKDDMSARRVSYKEPRAVVPFNQYLPNRSNQTNYIPAPLRKRRSEREEEWRSTSNATSPVSGEKPLREECVGALKEEGSSTNSQRTVTWAVAKGVEPELGEELKKITKLEKAGIKVLPSSVRYNNSAKVIAAEPDQLRSPSPDIILRRDNEFMRADHPHDWDANEDDDDEDEDRRVPDVQKDDLASRRARMNQPRPGVTRHFLPVGCSKKDQERWEGIRLASQHAVLERMEKMEQEKRSEADSASSEEALIITRKENPFLTPHGRKRAEEEEEESDEEGRGRAVVPDRFTDDLARRRARSRSGPQRDPRQSLVQKAITQSDLEKWQRLSLHTENSEASSSSSSSTEVSIITRKDNASLTPETVRQREDVKECSVERETEEKEKGVVPNVQKDDLARRRGQTVALPQQDPRLTLVQTAITQSDLEKWQRLKMSTDSSDPPPAPLCQACLEKGSILAAPPARVARGDLAAGRGRSPRDRRRFVTFGGVTELECVSWREEEEEEEEGRREGEGEESETLRRLLSTATVAMPTLGVSPGLTAVRVVGSEHAPNTAPAPASASESPLALVSDVKRSSAERDSALELRLTEKVKVEKEYEEKEDKEEEEEEEEEENEKDRQPDVEKDDMMARRTGLFQKGMSGTSYNQFLPLPGTRKKVAPVGQKEGSPLSRSAVVKDPLMLERNIKTKRFKIGQRADPVNTDPPSVSHKEPTVLSSASAHSDDYDDQRDDEGPLPDLEKDDMLARRAVLHHKQSGSQVQAFNVFLPKPGAAKRRTATAGGQNQGSEKEKKPTAESAVTPPSADVHNTPEKDPQMLDRQEAGTEGVMGGRSAVLGGANAKSPSPKPDPTPRRPFWLEDDDLPPTFSHKAANVSDESESVSLIDMRDEEEVDTLSPHSQLRHERLHNQYNKLREEEDQWQDDLARWKNRRRSASQDLIKKEEERKMMEKLMLKEEGGPRRKSIKTYKEIVEEKERREHELHELYCTASTPEEKAAVLQRYALRFTISDAILEKLQLPKLPSASTPEITPSPTHSRQQTTYTLNEEAELPVDLQPALTLQHQTQPHQHMPQTSVHSLPKTPELIPAPVPKVPKVPKIPEVPHLPTRIPPPPSKPVPLLTPKPYSQPKLNQASHKSVKTDGLVRLNGECGVEETRETPAVTPVVRPVTFCPAPPKPPAKTHQQEPEVSPSSESIAPQTTQTLSTVSSQIKEETDAPCSPQEKSSEEETSSTLTHSEITEEKQTVSNTTVKRNCVIKTTIVTELTQIHPVPTTDMSSTDQLSSSDASAQKPSDEVSSADSRQADDLSQSLSLTDGLDFTSECIETPILNLAKRVDHWTWDPNEERKRQERWQQEQERLLQEKYQQEQERLKKEWEKAQKEVEEEERKHNEEERRILEETTTPLTPSISAQSPPAVTECPAVSTPPQDSVVLSLADWDKKREMLEKQQKNGVEHSTDQAEAIAPAQQNGQGAEHQESQSATPQLQFIQDGTWSSKSESRSEWKKTASLDRNTGPSQAQPPRMRRTGSYENILGTHSSNSPPSSQDTPPPSPSRSVSGKKLCSSCAHPLGKGAAMIIETLGLYFHIQCFKCGVCKGLLGDTSTGTDVRIRNGVLNCQDCYIKSRAAGQPTTL
ncbi:LIM and calponin homology domains-containing protein 1 isoform X3 [Astyanax mexicanus]|uniref:LIM and calponin homology domains-containing protein 1 isoform X3 n=1 Tax=Astyanax mexicanus TaxID=7994 RepID=A0A8T2KIJ7_ASTMX|nr:LIM and calponin homology domains-containing protein 1 isoform X3 [Astyanax mexicanus]